MKKIFIFVISLILLTSVSACSKKQQTQGEESLKPSGLQVTENDTLMGWLKKGKTVECTVKTEMGEIKMYAQNEKVRMEGMPYYSMNSVGAEPKPGDGVSLTVGDMMYMWDKTKKKGTKMNLKEIENLGEELGEEKEQKTWEETVEDWEDAQAAYDCRETQTSNDIFKAPDDIEFMDLTAMMKEMAELGRGAEEKMNNNNFDDNELDEMMNKLKELNVPNIE